ncbi:MAG: manganese efflux pump [Polyangiaceae bacterium]|nr:manganese efflux pump [Polyangiaceae bacterium]
MDVASVLLLSVGLAMDAMAVSAARGLAVPALRPAHYASVALYFGGFQALMPLLGYLLGATFGDLVKAWDHWIAFALLAGIGGKMLLEALRGGEGDDEAPKEAEPFAFRVMLPLAVATSIDAFAAGLTLPLIAAPPEVSVLAIGVITGVLSAVGLGMGRRFGNMLGRKLDVLGGVVLILLGVKVLVEHLGG